MSVIQHRVERLEAIHGKAGTVEAVLKSLSREDLELTLAFLRHRLAELRNSSAARSEPDPVVLTGAAMLDVVAEARAWQASMNVKVWALEDGFAACASANRLQTMRPHRP